jgi:uncharacterized protein YjbI with pentapeptide repeats
MSDETSLFGKKPAVPTEGDHHFWEGDLPLASAATEKEQASDAEDVSHAVETLTAPAPGAAPSDFDYGSQYASEYAPTQPAYNEPRLEGSAELQDYPLSTGPQLVTPQDLEGVEMSMQPDDASSLGQAPHHSLDANDDLTGSAANKSATIFDNLTLANPQDSYQDWYANEARIIEEAGGVEALTPVEMPKSEEPAYVFTPEGPGEEAYEPVSDAEEIQAELAQIALLHSQWLESGGKDGRRAAIRNDRYRLADFTGMNLSEASFRGAQLGGTSFRGCDLSAADFSEANLQRASFAEANLTGAKFRKAQLNYADFSHTQMEGADLATAEADGARFNHAQMTGVSLRDAIMNNAIMMNANLSQANMRGTQLAGALMEETILTGADCRDANFERVRFVGANVAQAQFRNASLAGVDMNDTDFSMAEEVDPNFHAISVQQERDKLQEESQRLAILARELDNREKQMSVKRKAETRAKEVALAASPDGLATALTLQRASRWFMAAGAVWAVFALGLLAIVAMIIVEVGFSQIKLLELGIVLLIALLPLWLFVGSIRRALKIAKTLKSLASAAS